MTLTILKILSLLVAACFSLAEQFDEGANAAVERRKRKRGRIAILISLALAITAEAFEAFNKKAEAIQQQKENAENAEKTVRLLAQMDRSLKPIFPLRFHFTLTVGLNSPEIKSFKEALTAAFAAPGHTGSLDITPDLPFFPNPNKGSSAFALADGDLQMYVFIRKEPADVAQSNAFDPDLSYSVKGTSYMPPQLAPLNFDEEKAALRRHVAREYKPKVQYDGGDTMYYSCPYTTATQQECYFNGRIISVPDLLGAQIIISISPPVSKETLNTIQLSHVSFKLPGEREIQLPPERMTRFKDSHAICYAYTFPADPKEFEKLILP